MLFVPKYQRLVSATPTICPISSNHSNTSAPCSPPPPPVFPHGAGSSLGTGVGCQNDRLNLAQAHHRKRAPDRQTDLCGGFIRQTSQNRADLCLYIEANNDSLFSHKLTEKNTEAVNYLFECFICKQLVDRPWQRPSSFGSLTCQWQRALAARARSGLF